MTDAAKTSFQTPRSRAANLGTAHGGTHHWTQINLTGIALVPLTLLFVIPFAGVLGEGHEAAIALYRQPFHAIVAILFIGVTFHHLWQGLQVVIEDYVHHKGVLVAMLVANTLMCGGAGTAGVFAVMSIAFSG
ncbi:MAG: succinate dehydrogenase, hydrophobic membrane anchor protein [Pseudomonadota bacterium]